MSNTKIFAYKENLGAMTDLDNGEFINDPKVPGQLGCVVDCKNVDITKEAKELIKKAKREGGSFAALMLTKHAETVDKKMGEGSIGLAGFWKHHYGTEVEIGRDCELEVLELCNEVEIEVPEDYKAFIDG